MNLDLFRSIEAERTVVAACIMDDDFLSETLDALTVDHFTSDFLQIVFAACAALYRQGEKVQMPNLLAYLHGLGKEIKVSDVMAITSVYTGVNNARSAIKLLVEMKQKNMIRSKLTEALGNIGAAKPLDIAEQLAVVVDELYKTDTKRNEKTDSESLEEVMEDLQVTMTTGKVASGLLTGWMEMDLATNGFQKGDLVVIGARPSIGKTTFALNLNKKLNVNKHKGMMFSLEMGHKKIMMRRIAMTAGLRVNDMRFGRLNDWEMNRFNMVVNKIAKENRTIIDDSGGITVEEIRRRAKKAKQKYNIDYIIVDHINIIKGSTGNEQNRTSIITHISMNLKAMAKDLDIVVFALSQLNRALEGMAEKAPQLHHLRESGSLEQDADVVMLLHRDRKEQNDNDVVDFQVDVAKNRDGVTGIMMFDFDLPRQIIEPKGGR